MVPFDRATSEIVPLIQKLFPTYSLAGSISAVRLTEDSRITKPVVFTVL